MPRQEKSIAVACERLSALCMRQLQWLSSRTAGLEEDFITLYLWDESFKDGRLHDIAIFSPNLGVSILNILLEVGGYLLRLSPAHFDSIGAPQFRGETEKFTVGLVAAKDLLKSSDLMANSQDSEDNDVLSDDSDVVDDEIRSDLTFQIKLLMQLVPSMDRIFSQTWTVQHDVGRQRVAHDAPLRPESLPEPDVVDRQAETRDEEEPTPVQTQLREIPVPAGTTDEPPPAYVETRDPGRRQSAEGSRHIVSDTTRTEDPPIPKSLSDPNSINFFSSLLELSMIPAKYENPGLLDSALTFVPTSFIYANAEAEHDQLRALDSSNSPSKGDPSEMGYLDCVIRALLRWFKQSFFTFVGIPPCGLCGSATVPKGSTSVTAEEASHGARETELYQCTNCSTPVRFPRYSDAWKLLETRQGRGEEFANCFGMLCRAMGARVRLVWSSEDHRWVEVYSEYQRRWIHVDPCDETWDRPLQYTQGQGKRFAYCIAFSHDGATDVTRRYVRSRQRHGLPRKRVSEEVLSWIIYQIRKSRRLNLSMYEKAKLIREDEREEAELSSYLYQSVTKALLQKLSIREDDSTRQFPKEDTFSKADQKVPDRLTLPWGAKAEKLPWEAEADDPLTAFKAEVKFPGRQRFPWEVEAEDRFPAFAKTDQKLPGRSTLSWGLE